MSTKEGTTTAIVEQKNEPGQMVTEDMAALMREHSHGSDFQKEDLGTPFVVIVQAASGFAKRSDPAYIDGAVEGDIIDTLTQQLRKKAAFIPAKYQIEFTEWGPNRGPLIRRWGADRSGYEEARKYVHQGKFVDWGPRLVLKDSFDDQGPDTAISDGDVLSEITPAGVYYGLLVDESGTSLESVLALTGTQAKKSRRFNDLIHALELVADGKPYKPPMFARLYGLTTVPERSDEHSWMGWKIEPGPLTLTVPGGVELFKKAAAVRQRADEGKIKTMETGAATEAQRSDGGDGLASKAADSAAPKRTARDLDDDIPFDLAPAV